MPSEHGIVQPELNPECESLVVTRFGSHPMGTADRTKIVVELSLEP